MPRRNAIANDLIALIVIGSAIIVGGLSFFPALALGPIVEHFRMIGFLPVGF
jgi:K+-transporting ATPase ATPase A chain